LDAQDVIYVPRLKRNFLSVLVMENRDFVFTFQRGKVLIRPEIASSDTVVVVGVREGTLYRLEGKFV